MRHYAAQFRSRLGASLGEVPFREIGGLVWPQVMTLLCGIVISLTDIWVAGRISPAAQGSVGVASQVQMFLMVVAHALGAGGMAAVSQSLGAGRFRRARLYSDLVLTAGLLLSVAAAAIVWACRMPVLSLLGVPGGMREGGAELMGIMLAGLPAFYAVQIGGTLFRAGRQVVIPLFILAAACAVNVAGDMLFGLGCFGAPMLGIAGIGWSTVAANCLGAVLTMLYLRRRGLSEHPFRVPAAWAAKAVPYLARVALPAAGNSVIWQAGYLVMFAIVGTLPDGVEALAGMTAGNRIESMLYMPAGAFMTTAAILVGNALGAGDRAAAKKAGLALFWISAVAMGSVAACMWPFLDVLAAAFSDEAGVRAQIVSYLFFNVLVVPFTVSGMALHGVMNGAGATVYSFAVNGACIWLIRLPLGWFLSHHVYGDAYGLYLSMFISMVVQTSVMAWVFLRRDWASFAFRSGAQARKTG